MTLARSDVPFIEAGPDSCGLKKFSHVPNMSRDSMIEVGPLPSVPVTRNEVQSESKREVLE